MARRRWSIQDAKRHFNDLVAAARRKPQVVTKDGKAAVVIIAASEFERLCKLGQLEAPSFAELLLAIPQGDVKCDRSFDARAAKLRKVTKRRKQTPSEVPLREGREDR